MSSTDGKKWHATAATQPYYRAIHSFVVSEAARTSNGEMMDRFADFVDFERELSLSTIRNEVKWEKIAVLGEDNQTITFEMVIIWEMFWHPDPLDDDTCTSIAAFRPRWIGVSAERELEFATAVSVKGAPDTADELIAKWADDE